MKTFVQITTLSSIVALIVVSVTFLDKLVKKTILTSNSKATENHFPISGDHIRLPIPNYDGAISLEQALLKRRTVREYSNEPITFGDLSQLLWAAQGITSKHGKRTAPSPNAIYPFKIYVMVNNVEYVAPALYLYDTPNHALSYIREGDLHDELSSAAFNQTALKTSAVTLILVAILEKVISQFEERGEQFVYTEAGHIAQNIYLQTVPLNLGTVSIGSFDRDAVKKILQLEEAELVIYLIPIGKILK